MIIVRNVFCDEDAQMYVLFTYGLFVLLTLACEVDDVRQVAGVQWNAEGVQQEGAQHSSYSVKYRTTNDSAIPMKTIVGSQTGNTRMDTWRTGCVGITNSHLLILRAVAHSVWALARCVFPPMYTARV